MSEWRLIYLNEFDGYWNMAIDEAMLIMKSKGKIPNTLRLYRFTPSAVTIGFFQSPKEEVNIEFCRKNGIEIVRRITGGGTVYHDENGEITYSIVVSEKDAPKDILRSYELFCSGIVKALERLGLKAEFHPINDVLVSGKKISGSAQTRRRGVVLQHGTLMYNTDISTLAVTLKVIPEKLKDKGVTKLEERVTTISKALSRHVSRDEVVQAMIEGFAEALQVKFHHDELTSEELELAEKLMKEKYSKDEWNFMV
ncbi:MAG: lipoate--protein ligase family protein [archaeon GB-1867-005]|nr:lipoate--protein ligase family protein [Candidatus Culexmicrobium cathedralense]